MELAIMINRSHAAIALSRGLNPGVAPTVAQLKALERGSTEIAVGAAGLLASLIPKGGDNRIESSASQRTAKASELVPETNHIYF